LVLAETLRNFDWEDRGLVPDGFGFPGDGEGRWTFGGRLVVRVGLRGSVGVLRVSV
jgi:hypothetical protein